MALNFFGLGFTFGAKDDGLGKQLKNTDKQFDNLEDSVDGVSEASSNMAQKITAAAAAFGAMKLGEVSGKLEDISDKFTDGLPDVEETRLAIDKTAKQLDVLGMMGVKDLNRLIGTTSKWGISLQDTNNTILEMRKRGMPTERWEHALDNAAAHNATFGTGLEDTIRLISGLEQGFDFSEKQVDNFQNGIIAAGLAFGQMEEAGQAAPKIFDTLNENIAEFVDLQDPEKMSRWGREMSAFAGILSKELGVSFEDAVGQSGELMGTLLGSRSEFEKMISGLEGEFPALVSQMGIGMQDIDKSFQMLQDSPLEFMQKIAQLGGSAEDISKMKKIMVANFGEVGKSMAYLTGGGLQKSEEALGEFYKTAGDSEKAGTIVANAMDKMGESSENIAKRYDRAQENINLALKGITKGATDAYKDARAKASNAAVESINAFGKMTSPMAKFAQKLLILKQEGLMPFLYSFEQLRNSAMMQWFDNLGLTIEDLIPVFAGLGGAALILSKIAPMIAGIPGPLKLLMLAVAGAGYLFTKSGHSFQELVDAFNEGDTIPDKIKNVFNLLKTVVKEGMKNLLPNGLGGIFEFDEGTGNKLGQQAGVMIGGMSVWIMNALEGIGAKVGPFIGEFLAGLISKIPEWLPALKDVFATVIEEAIGFAFGMISGMLDSWGFPDASKAVTEFGDNLEGVGEKVMKFTGSFIIIDKIATTFSNLTKSVKGLVTITGKAPGSVGKIGKAFQFIGKIIKGVGKTVGFVWDIFKGGMKMVKSIGSLFGKVGGFVSKMLGPLKIVGKLFRVLGKAFVPLTIIFTIVDAVKGFIAGFKSAGDEVGMFQRIALGVFGAVKSVIEGLLEPFIMIWNWLDSKFQLNEMFTEFGQSISMFAESAWTSITGVFTRLWAWFENLLADTPFEALPGMIAETFAVVTDFIKRPFIMAWDFVKELFTIGPAEAFGNLGEKIFEWLADVGMFISGPFIAGWDIVKNFFTVSVPETFNNIIAAIVAVAENIWTAVTDPFIRAYGWVEERFAQVSNLFSRVVDSITSFGQTILSAVTSPFQEAWAWLENLLADTPFSGVPDLIMAQLSRLVDIIKFPFVTSWNFVKDLFTVGPKEAFGGLGERVMGLIGNISDVIGAPFNAAWDFVKNIFDWSAMFDFGSGIGDKIGALKDDVIGKFEGMWESIKKVFSWDTIFNFGQIIANSISAAYQKFAAFFSAIGKSLKAILNPFGPSPSEVFKEAMANAPVDKGVSMPKLHEGGDVLSEGKALLQKGETVIPPAKVEPLNQIIEKVTGGETGDSSALGSASPESLAAALAGAMQPVVAAVMQMVNMQRALLQKPPLKITFDDARFARVWRIMEDNNYAMSEGG